jgi:hypothetical protein
VGYVVEKVAQAQVFSKYFGFPCQFSFHQVIRSHVSPGAGIAGQSVSNVLGGFKTHDNSTLASHLHLSLPHGLFLDPSFKDYNIK